MIFLEKKNLEDRSRRKKLQVDAEAYLEPSRTSTMEPFCEHS